MHQAASGLMDTKPRCSLANTPACTRPSFVYPTTAVRILVLAVICRAQWCADANRIKLPSIPGRTSDGHTHTLLQKANAQAQAQVKRSPHLHSVSYWYMYMGQQCGPWLRARTALGGCVQPLAQSHLEQQTEPFIHAPALQSVA